MVENKHELSIGEVSTATGISVYKLRQWERRYGYPRSIKRASGHRRYSINEVSRLRLVSQSLSLGLRASKIVPMEYGQLLKVIEGVDESAYVLAVEKWLQCVKEWDQNQLAKFLELDWDRFGAIEFLKQRVIPFINRIGESWLLNEVSIAQEHFFSELLESFLAKKWRQQNHKNSGGVYVLAAPEGEGHCLGLHMCAIALTFNNKKVMFLGVSTPFAEIISASKKVSAKAVCLSFSAHYPMAGLEKQLVSFYSQLERSTQ